MAYDKCNFIVNSEILKTQNCIENKARKEWKAKWGFYLDLDKIIIDEAKQRGLSESEYKRIVIKKKPKGTREPYIWITHSNRGGPMLSSGTYLFKPN
ncbi:hypothetical protein HUJ04_005438 [Dendroctonus ponderosae]|nr:hypothetical protein HUJ04_005438 [Dendroctonus ponderosae]KAH1009980.1 hypothetical protein HUJ05_004345 [Dendroctonus ponderosae]